MFQSSAMQHFVCLLLVLSLAGVSTAAEPVTSGETAYSALETTLAEQVRASAAEQEYREYQRNSAERLKQLGQAPAEELRDAYELATQAAEWSRLLNLQQTRLHAVNPSAPDHTDGIILRVPGLPAAFFDDPFSTVPIPSGHRVSGIVAQINSLFTERHSLSPNDVHQQHIADRLSRQQRLDDAMPVQDIQRDRLRQEAVLLEPIRLDEVLLMPIQHRMLPEHSIRAHQSRTGRLLFSQFTRSWIVDSRRLLATQAERTIQRLQTRRQLLLQLSDDDAGADISFLDTQLDAIRHLSHRFRREIMVAGGRHDSTNLRPAIRTPSDRMALLMRMTKDSYDVIQMELTATSQQRQHLTAGTEILKELSSGDPTLAGELNTLHNQMTVAAAVEQQQLAESDRRRALVRFAIALYRLESGRDSDSTRLNTQRSRVFALHADRSPELDVIHARAEVAQSRLASLQRLYAEGHTDWGELKAAGTEVGILAVERRRAELRMETGILCEELLQLADEAPVLAQH